MANTIPFTRGAVKSYLDSCIKFWRKKRDEGGDETELAEHYVDAYQSMRSSIFGSTLPEQPPA